MTFRKAVESTASIAESLEDGLQALPPADRARLRISDPRLLRGSVNVDRALHQTHPIDSRWDYSVGLEVNRSTELALWIEVHPANSLHVDTVIKKRRWLRGWLQTAGAELKKITPGRNYVWLATSAVALPQNSSQRKKLAEEGVQLRSQRLNLDEYRTT